jgi:hypothetical protein
MADTTDEQGTIGGSCINQRDFLSRLREFHRQRLSTFPPTQKDIFKPLEIRHDEILFVSPMITSRSRVASLHTRR